MFIWFETTSYAILKREIKSIIIGKTVFTVAFYFVYAGSGQYGQELYIRERRH